MARGWRVIDATTFEGSISGKRGRITFKPTTGEPSELPAEELAVVLIGDRTSITSAALHYSTKHDVVLLAADWKGVPYAGIYPWADHTRVGARHLAQARLSVPRKKNGWMQVVRAKVRGQAANLVRRDPGGAERLLDLAKSVRTGDPANVEGLAARLYWARLFPTDLGFGREPGATDALNGMLNYGYTVLRGFGIRAVLSAGLSPPLGLFHRGRSNYFNLVDDLIEPYRPAIDAIVCDLARQESLEDAELRHKLVAAASQPFTSDGTRIPASMDDLAQQVGRYVEGDIAKLRVNAWSGPIALNEAEAYGQA